MKLLHHTERTRIYKHGSYVIKTHTDKPERLIHEQQSLVDLHLTTGTVHCDGWSIRVNVPVRVSSRRRYFVARWVEGIPYNRLNSYETALQCERCIAEWYRQLLVNSKRQTGSYLLHGDLNNENILINEKERTIHILDPGRLSGSIDAVHTDIIMKLMSNIRLCGYRPVRFYKLNAAFLDHAIRPAAGRMHPVRFAGNLLAFLYNIIPRLYRNRNYREIFIFPIIAVGVYGTVFFNWWNVFLTAKAQRALRV